MITFSRIRGYLIPLWLAATGALAGVPAAGVPAAGVPAAGVPVSPSDSGRTAGQLPARTTQPERRPPERRPPVRQSTVDWPIDAKVDTVLRLINTGPPAKSLLARGEQQRRQERFADLFAPSGYFIVMLPNKTERWMSARQFLDRLNAAKGVQYQLKAAKVIHFSEISRNPQGQYSSRATVYFDVNRFDNHVPVTQTTSRVMIPLAQTPPAADYWQIYELKVVEVSNSLLASPPPAHRQK